MDYELDLRGIACPMNFVKTRLFLDRIETGDRLSVLLDAGEPAESVSQSVLADGHAIELSLNEQEGHFRLIIRKG